MRATNDNVFGLDFLITPLQSLEMTITYNNNKSLPRTRCVMVSFYSALNYD
jgi:hypothetical protein